MVAIPLNVNFLNFISTVKSLNLSDSPHIADGYEFSLTTDGSGDPYYHKFKPHSGDAKYAESPPWSSTNELLPSLVGTEVESVVTEISAICADMGLVRGRVYFRSMPAVSINRYRKADGVKLFAYSMANNHKTMILTRHECFPIPGPGMLYFIDSLADRTMFNGSLVNRASVMFVEARDAK